MARKIVTLRESAPEAVRKEAATAVLDQMFGYFDAMESRFPIQDDVPQAA